MKSNYTLWIFILLIIILFSLAIEIYSYYQHIEGYSNLDNIQLADMSSCSKETAGCKFMQYYDISGSLKNGYYLNVPMNFYLDSSSILQAVPYGNEVNKGGYGYSPTTRASYYTQQAHLEDNAIENPVTCEPSNNTIYYPNTPSVCADVSYIVIKNGSPQVLKGQIIIPDGYYNNSGIVTSIPYGYTSNPEKTSISINMDYYKSSSSNYDSNNYNITYHTDISSGGTYADSITAGAGQTWIIDKSGNLISVPYSDVSGNTLYYEPGSFRFGPSNYVPKYEDSVYLSKLTNTSTVSEIYDSARSGPGFCSVSTNPNELEEKCNSLDKNICGSTSCCVLLGGQKCVYGSESGPFFKANYSNFLIKNPEFYYYQGKCYGNCNRSYSNLLNHNIHDKIDLKK
jgi:hypothetical protein